MMANPFQADVDESHIGSVVVTAGHVTIDWAADRRAPKEVTAGVRFILKDIKGNLGFFWRDDMGVVAFPITAVDYYER
jgi:hypothetical protein